jgi:hypothetical protein
VRSLLLVSLAACGRFGVDRAADADASDAPGPLPDIVYYNMDDDPQNGVLANDRRLDAKCADTDTCPYMVPGKVGNGAYRFSGSQYIELPLESSYLADTSPYSCTVWIRPGSNGSNGGGGLVAKPFSATASTDVFAIQLRADRTPYFESTKRDDGMPDDGMPDDGTPDYAYANRPLDEGTWYHIATTWDGSYKRLYIAGEMVGFETAQLKGAYAPLWIGTDVDNGVLSNGGGFSGDLDELVFYNHVLPQIEIKKIMKLGGQ